MDNETETDIDTDFMEFNGDRWEGLFTTKEGKGVLVHTAGHRKEWIVFRTREDAGEAARAYWQNMADNDSSEFRCLVGDKALIAWGMGEWGGPGSTQVRSLTEWLDLWLETPEEHFASYDGEEIEDIEVGAEFEEEIGFRPAVAYCRSF